MLNQIDNIILLGTSHVSSQSAKEIEAAIEQFKPEVVGIELDYTRLKTLLSSKKNKRPSTLKLIKMYGAFGGLFAALASTVQQSIGKSLNIEPGTDMKTAYLKAREHKLTTALIDIPINITLRGISSIPFTTKLSMFSKLFFKSFSKKYRTKLYFDPKKGVPPEHTILEMMKILHKEAPALYNILIEKRNKVMSEKLLALKEKHEGPILAVVGAGHVSGMREYLQRKLHDNENKLSFSFKVELEG